MVGKRVRCGGCTEEVRRQLVLNKQAVWRHGGCETWRRFTYRVFLVDLDQACLQQQQ